MGTRTPTPSNTINDPGRITMTEFDTQTPVSVPEPANADTDNVEPEAEPFDYMGWLDEFAAKGANADAVVGPFMSQVWPEMKTGLVNVADLLEQLRKVSPPSA